jgi:hypothetical protein
MENELTRFAKAFRTEADLIKSIATMFRRRTDITGVHILDGTHERGKDLVFYAIDPVGQRTLHACVVKNKKIAGSTGSAYSPMTVLEQAKQALQTSYHTPTGQEEYVSQVHIMCPHELPASSLYAIQGGLRGNGTFCCGGQLLEMFKLYWPDFLFDTGSLGIYITQLQSRIDKDDPVSVLFSDHSIFFGSAGLKKTYVRQSFHVTLAHLAFLGEVPTLKDLQSRMTLDKANAVRKTLMELVAMLEIPHVRYRSPDTDEPLRIVHLLADRVDWIKTSWDKAYRDYERDSLSRTVTPQVRSKAQIQLRFNDSDRDEFEQILSYCATAVSFIQRTLISANQFVGTVRTVSLEMLKSDGYLSYCRGQEMANLLPDTIRTTRQESYPLSNMNIEDVGSVVITGSAGYGKSSFCFHHAKADAIALIEKKSTLLPVYVKLHQLSAHKLGTYQEEFYVTSELSALADPENSAGKGRIERIRLYLDGMDEIPRIERQREITELALQAQVNDPRIEIVITARDYVHGPWLNSMPRIKLNELDDAQINELVAGLLDGNQEQIVRFHVELKKVPSLKSLMQIPLLATLIVSVFRKRTALPENRVKLYDIFLDLLCGGWDLIKNVSRPTEFGVPVKLAMLTRLAGLAHLNKKRTFTLHDIRIAIRDSNPSLEPSCQPMTAEIVQNGVLIRSGSTYAFKHLSFQEYLAALDLNEPSGKKQKKVLRWYLGGDEWWFQTLSFYVGMLRKPQQTEEWIADNAPNASNMTYSIAARISRLIQAINDSYPGYTSQRLQRLTLSTKVNQ